MPVTAKLSRKFYETFGDEIANELVEWFNSVDLTYRTDLRELADLQYSRFDAKLEQRIGWLDAKLEQRIGVLEGKLDQMTRVFDAKLELRTGVLEGKIDQVAKAADAKLDQRVAELRQEMGEGFARLEGELAAGLAVVRADLAGQRADLIKWMFLFWLGSVTAIFIARAL